MRGIPRGLTFRTATPLDRERTTLLRHEVFARELGQYPVNDDGRLTDPVDAVNTVLVAARGEDLAGYVSLTPPGGPLGTDKYVERSAFPFPLERAFEVRLLTVAPPYRRSALAVLLMWAALRWVEAADGKRIVATGRVAVLPMYRRLGLDPLGRRFEAGAVAYELMSGTTAAIRAAGLDRIGPFLRSVESRIGWELPYAFL